MSSFKELMNIDNFSIEKMDISGIKNYSNWLPSHSAFDINISQEGMVITLQAINLCQEKIIQLDKWISLKESEKKKTWTEAALVKAPNAGHKTMKAKEWFAQADEAYIDACNELNIAFAAKRWLEGQASQFSRWHYLFKSFASRDSNLEKIGNFQMEGYNSIDPEGHTSDRDDDNWCDE